MKNILGQEVVGTDMDLMAKFRKRAFVISVVFIFFILQAIALFWLYGLELDTVRMINVVVDIFGMIMGYMLFICCVLDVHKVGKIQNAFLGMLVTDFFAMFVDEAAWLVDGIPSMSFWNVLSNTLLFASGPLIAYLFWRYASVVLRIEDDTLKKWDRVYFTGLIVALGMRVLNLFTGIYFTVDAMGVYHRSVLHPVSNVYTYLTLIATLVVVWVERKRLKTVQLVTFFMYVLFPLFVGLCSIFFYGVSITNASIMLIILLMYCMFNVVQGREQLMADKDLAMAASIQENMLPQIFPPYPERDEFDLFASMTPAKEVGGDFYDFFLVDEDHLAMVIADVSGKGVPAALFMMVSKALIKNRTMADCSDLSKVFGQVNDQLCEGNKVEMFVTAWLGVLTISTGELRTVNAGHEYPAVSRQGGAFELLKDTHGLPLATMEGMTYREESFLLMPGDTLYVYTDGVVEAVTESRERFGMERMLEALNRNCQASPKELDRAVRETIQTFIGKTPQFDDVTMLCIKYTGK